MAVIIRTQAQNTEAERQTASPGLRRPGLKVSWLAYFIEVSRKAQLAAAAQSLGITPQALRRNLDQLESHLGVQLIQYHGKILQLTPCGEDFLAEAFELFYALRRLNGPEPPPPVLQSQTLQLGWTKSWLQNLLVDLCSEVRQILPEHRLNIQHLAGQRELEQALLDGRLDLALLWSPPESELLASLAVEPSPFVIVSAPQPLRPWDTWTYAIPAPELTALQPWSDDLHPRKIQLQANSLYALLDMACSGQCAVYLPECLIRSQLRQNQLVRVARPPVQHMLTPSVCWREPAAPELQNLLTQLSAKGFH